MDRDIAITIANGLESIKNTMTALATNTIPTSPDSRSVSPAPAEDQRSVQAEETEKLETPIEEHETQTKK